jgi:hypothetical protein
MFAHHVCMACYNLHINLGRWKWPERQAAGLPFPTYLGDQQTEVVMAPSDKLDPYRVSTWQFACHDLFCACALCYC